MKLSDLKIKNAKPKARPYKLTDGHGLYLLIKPAGGKLWQMKYSFSGKERTASFGPWPAVTLKKARERREEIREQKYAGEDPAQLKRDKDRKAMQASEETFEKMAREWAATIGATWTDRHRQNILKRMERDVFPEFGKMPIRDIKPVHVMETLRKIESRGAAEIARRLFQNTGAVFRFAVQSGRLDSDPSRDLKGALKGKRTVHYAALSPERLPVFLAALDRNEQRLYPQTIRAVKLLMLTMTRTNELRQASWKEIDLDKAMWTIPESRMKMRRDHLVPLSRQAIDLLREQKETTGDWEWVFPNQVRLRLPMSDGTILGAIRRLGFKGETTGHGFRALAMSAALEVLNYRHEVPDRQLAHAPKSKNDRAYVRAEFLDDRKRLMQDWADYLDRVRLNA